MDIAKLLIELALLLLTIYIAFFKSYINEKGKNLATQEDIGDITQIVEQIRTDLAKDTELLKSELSLYNQNKFSIKSAEREALFSLSKTYSSWLYSLMNFSFQGYDEDNIIELEKVAPQYDKLRYDFALAQCQLKLFMFDGELLDLIKNLTLTTIDVEVGVVSHIRNYKYQFTIYEIENKRPDSDKIALHKKLYEDLKKILTEFHKDRIEKYKKAYDEEVKLSKLIKKRMDLIKE